MSTDGEEFDTKDLFILGVLGVFSVILIFGPSLVGLWYLYNWYKEKYVDAPKKELAQSSDAEVHHSRKSKRM